MQTAFFAVQIESPLLPAQRAILARCLPPPRAARLQREKERRRDEVLCAYGLLAAALAERFGRTCIPKLSVSARGKPLFADRADLHFSLSHTQGTALVGLSPMPLGVDAERLRPAPERLSRRFALAADEAFWASWTRREALAKLRDEPPAVWDRDEAPLRPGEHLIQLTGLRGCAAAAAGIAPLPSCVEVLSVERLLEAAAGP